jgi:23S rRNA (cytidine2498-2'-O)-methyltransferase
MVYAATAGTSFFFVLCQPGAEAVLKCDVALHHPELVAAFQRPGLVTFRSDAAVTPDSPLHSAFARCYGQSLGMARDVDAALMLLPVHASPLVLHVAERPTHRAAFAAFEARPSSLLAERWARDLRALAPTRFSTAREAPDGALVVTLSVAEGEPALVGLHRQQQGRVPYAGGAYPIEVPAQSPSRAYGKIEEAIVHFGLAVRPGETALELGAAPGGAAFALLRRGVHVVGVDPGDMDPYVLSYVGAGGARLVHHAFKASALTAAHLPRRVEHLLVDVHLAPPVALRAIRKALSLVRSHVRNVVWTVKLNDWSLAAQLPVYVAELRSLGVRDAIAQQLVANRQEVCIAGRMEA